MVGPQHRRVVGPSTQVDPESEESDDLLSMSRPDWLARGQTIGRYVVLECLGVGGMGVIYSAWDPKLDRKLAIKVVRARHGRLGSTRGRARLLREGQALARLRHPNVITVHDVGTHEGQVFVAMEFVEGRTLHDRLQQGPRPPVREIIDMFLQIGRGLAAAHRAGLVHRDVKPENVMIGDDGRVLVLDFGIAREGLGPDSEVLDPEHGEVHDVELDDSGDLGVPTPRGVPHEVLDDHTPLASLTKVGAIVGTPAYMSPEQHRGLGVDARGDQFAFCLAMWEALNGEKPYGEGSRQKLLARMRLGHIRPFRNREVPRRVGVALRRGLAWSPDDRHPSMETLLEALNPRGRVLESRLGRGLAIGSIASIGGMLLGIAATVMSLGMDDPPSPEAPSCARAGQQLAEVWNQERSSTIARAFAATGLERASPSWVRAHEHLDGWAARWVSARDRACAAHFVDHRDSATTHDQRVACLEQQRVRFAELLALLEHADAPLIDGAVAAAIELPSPELCADAQHLHELARVMPEPESLAARQRLTELRAELEQLERRAELGRWREELEHSRQLAAAAREARHPPVLARALLIHAAYLEHADREHVDPLGAEALLLEAAGLAAMAGDDRTQARALTEAARHISASGRHDEAMRWLEFAQAVASTTSSRVVLGVAIADTRASIDAARGQPELAREQLRAAVTQLEGTGDPTLALSGILHHLALVDAEIGDAREAVQLLRRALVLDEQAYGPTHVRVAAIRHDLARVLEQRGEQQAAIAEYQRALAIYEHIHGPGRETAQVRTDIGLALARTGRCAQAWPALTRAIVELRTDAPDSLLLASSLEALARACDFSHADAAAHASEAVGLRERLQGPTHPELGEALAIEALCLVAIDQPELALSKIERALELGPVDDRVGFLLAAHGLTLAALERDGPAREQLERARAALLGDEELGPRIDQALAGL
jgi:serine/threonine protein kinase/tetratricopeptide (TPR) repeat protein